MLNPSGHSFFPNPFGKFLVFKLHTKTTVLFRYVKRNVVFRHDIFKLRCSYFIGPVACRIYLNNASREVSSLDEQLFSRRGNFPKNSLTFDQASVYLFCSLNAKAAVVRKGHFG